MSVLDCCYCCCASPFAPRQTPGGSTNQTQMPARWPPAAASFFGALAALRITDQPEGWAVATAPVDATGSASGWSRLESKPLPCGIPR